MTLLNFNELMATNPPRIVIMFRRGDGGEEQFQWGVAGNVPVLTMIGAAVRVQCELPLIEPGDSRHSCPEQHLVLVWDQSDRRVRWFVGPDIPLDPLMGMLETVKDALVSSQLAQRAVSQQSRLLGPDGLPARG